LKGLIMAITIFMALSSQICRRGPVGRDFSWIL